MSRSGENIFTNVLKSPTVSFCMFFGKVKLRIFPFLAIANLKGRNDWRNYLVGLVGLV